MGEEGIMTIKINVGTGNVEVFGDRKKLSPISWESVNLKGMKEMPPTAVFITKTNSNKISNKKSNKDRKCYTYIINGIPYQY